MTPEIGGPRTASQNATKLGLFAACDYVRPEEQCIYEDLCAAMQADLSPTGPLENTLAAQIAGAAWRLRRCSLAEAELADRSLPDPMLCEDEQSVRIQNSVDRARAAAHNVLRKSMAELRRLQTERILRDEIFLQQPVPTDIGLTDYQQILKALHVNEKGALLAQRVEKGKLAASSFCITDPALPQTPRNAACPCGSGLKHKRCCGKNAPPVLQKAA